MQFFQKLFDQLSRIWNGADLRSRILFSMAAVLVAAGTTLVVYWSLQPQYRVLANNLSPNDASLIKSQLDAADIPNQFDFAGTSISVPHNRMSEARIAAKDFLAPGVATSDFGADSVFPTPSQDHDRRLRRMEQNLEATISSFQGIQRAKVHIAKNPRPIIGRDESRASATVVVTFAAGAQLGGDEAEAIAFSVVNAVGDMDPEDVHIADTHGRTYSIADHGMNDVSKQFALIRGLESRLAHKAQDLLQSRFGPNRAKVTVSAQLDFKSVTTTEETYDPDGQTVGSERIVTTSTDGDLSRTGGVTGATANTQPSASTTIMSAGGSSTEHEELDTIYLNSKLDRQQTEPPGKILRISVAAIVDLSSDADEAAAADAGGAAVPAGVGVTPADLTEVERLISMAVGLDPKRGDEIIVSQGKLYHADQVEADLLLMEKWDFWRDLSRNVSLGIGAITSLLIAFIVLRKMTPVTVMSADEGRDSQHREQVISELSERIRENPDALQELMSAWLEASDDKPASGPRIHRAA